MTFSRTRNRFFLSWQGYPPSSNTWEPFKSFSDKETPLNFLNKLKSCGAICDSCIKIAKSSSALSPANVCECARRSPSPIVTPGKRAIDMLKQADAPKQELPIQSKRPRDESNIDSPKSPSNSTTTIAKAPKKSLPSVIASRPSEALLPKKTTSRPKIPPAIHYPDPLVWSDDDNEPLQAKPSTAKLRKESSPVTSESGSRRKNDVEAQSSEVISPRSPCVSSPQAGVATNTFAAHAILNHFLQSHRSTHRRTSQHLRHYWIPHLLCSAAYFITETSKIRLLMVPSSRNWQLLLLLLRLRRSKKMRLAS